jgi:hypothetical protein
VKHLKDGLHFTLGDNAAQSNVLGAALRNGYLEIAPAEAEDKILLTFPLDGLGLNFFDNSRPVMRVYNLVSNAEHFSTSPFMGPKHQHRPGLYSVRPKPREKLRIFLMRVNNS